MTWTSNSVSALEEFARVFREPVEIGVVESVS
jgi:hypothetical protein